MGKNKHGMLDHGKDKVLRKQIYWRCYQRELDILEKHLTYVKDKYNINKSEWIRKAILDSLIKERKAIKESSKS